MFRGLSVVCHPKVYLVSGPRLPKPRSQVFRLFMGFRDKWHGRAWFEVGREVYEVERDLGNDVVAPPDSSSQQ